MLLTVDEGVLDRKLAIAEEVKVESIIDTDESGGKIIYQLAEVLIYFGWPLLVMWLFTSVSPKVDYLWVAAVGLLTFFWPYVKGLIGVLIAKAKGIKDPRHAIRSSSFWFDGLFFVGSPALREIRQYSALSRSLDVIYNIFGRFGIKPAKFVDDKWADITFVGFLNRIIRRWSLFWIGMPIAQDVRSRLDIIAEEYRKKIRALAFVEPGRMIQILDLAGGQ